MRQAMRMWKRMAAPALALAALLLVGCGGGDDGAGPSGVIQIGGSSTVYPITQAVAEEYLTATGGDVRVTVGVSGTGGGFQRFCRGQIPIVNASRPIQDIERERCERTGVEPVEFTVALDGIAVVVNPANDFVECLTMEELRLIWKPQSPVETWSDIRPEWPDVPIQLFGPGTSSGTFDYFTETVVGEEDASRADYTASERDDVLVQGVAGDEQALGYFGYAYYAENKEELQIVEISAGEECIAPTPETIESGRYPLSRPLFIYVNKEALGRPAVRDFVRFYLEQASELVPAVGYVALSEARYQAQLEKLQQKTTSVEPAA